MPRDNRCTCTYPDRCDGLGFLFCIGRGCRCPAGAGTHEQPCLGCPACTAITSAVPLAAVVGAAPDGAAPPAAHRAARAFVAHPSVGNGRRHATGHRR